MDGSPLMPPLGGNTAIFALRVGLGGVEEIRRSRDALAAKRVARNPTHRIEILPAVAAARQTAAWRGLSGEVVRTGGRETFACHYCGPSHLLIAYQRAVRHAGDSSLGDLPKSTLHDLSRKLTFVPAGSWFDERHDPSGSMQAVYLYIDPKGPLMDQQSDPTKGPLPPRLLFDNRALWETTQKLANLIEQGETHRQYYAEALGTVLAHELLLLDSEPPRAAPATLGGLAGWQRRVVAQYIESNLAEKISLSMLADIARLSPYHFSRAFRKSFGMPPRRYHLRRRIEWAMTLLAEPRLSITEIAYQVGFADASSFSVAFHNLVGRSPREYRRNLA